MVVAASPEMQQRQRQRQHQHHHLETQPSHLRQDVTPPTSTTTSSSHDDNNNNVQVHIQPLAEAPLCNPSDALEILARTSLCRQDGDSDSDYEEDEDEGEGEMMDDSGRRSQNSDGRAEPKHADPGSPGEQQQRQQQQQQQQQRQQQQQQQQQQQRQQRSHKSQPHGRPGVATAADAANGRSNIKPIDDFLLVKKGLINPTQLRTYVSIYISRHNHYVPIIPEYRLPNNDHHRLAQFASEEPFLLMVMVLIVSRYEKSAVHVSCWKVVRDHISQITYGGLPTVGVVEGLLLLSEYLPSLRNVADSNFHQVEASMSWNLIGLAIRLSYFLGLDQRALLDPGAISDERTSRERLVWTYCYIFDRHISIRLGKPFWSRGGLAFRNRPAANTTNVSGEAHNNFPTLAPNGSRRFASRDGPDTTRPVAEGEVTVGDESTLVQAYVELTQILTNIHSTLYPSRDRTLALSHVGDYTRMLDEFTRTLTWFRITWIEKHRWEKFPFSETIRATFHYAKLYAYSFSFQAHVGRATANNKMLFQDVANNSNGNAAESALANLFFPRGLAESPDVKYILEAIDSATELLKICAQDLFPQGALGFLPTRFYGYFSYAAVFLMKVVLTQAVVRSERERIMRLISSAIAAIQSSSSSFTTQHLGVRSSRQLRKLFRMLIAVTGTDLTPTGGIVTTTTPGDSSQARHPEAMDWRQPASSEVQADGDFSFWLNMLEANPMTDAAASTFLMNSPPWLPGAYMQEVPHMMNSGVNGGDMWPPSTF